MGRRSVASLEQQEHCTGVFGFLFAGTNYCSGSGGMLHLDTRWETAY